jgi:hypothetical protein
MENTRMLFFVSGPLGKTTVGIAISLEALLVEALGTATLSVTELNVADAGEDAITGDGTVCNARAAGAGETGALVPKIANATAAATTIRTAIGTMTSDFLFIIFR